MSMAETKPGKAPKPSKKCAARVKDRDPDRSMVLLHGTLQVYVNRALKLADRDMIGGNLSQCLGLRENLSDPYVEVYIDKKRLLKTAHIYDNLNPVWDTHHALHVAAEVDTLEVRVLDFNGNCAKPDDLGFVKFKANQVLAGEIAGWFPLQGRNANGASINMAIRLIAPQMTSLMSQQPDAYFPERLGNRITFYQDACTKRAQLQPIEVLEPDLLHDERMVVRAVLENAEEQKRLTTAGEVGAMIMDRLSTRPPSAGTAGTTQEALGFAHLRAQHSAETVATDAAGVLGGVHQQGEHEQHQQQMEHEIGSLTDRTHRTDRQSEGGATHPGQPSTGPRSLFRVASSCYDDIWEAIDGAKHMVYVSGVVMNPEIVLKRGEGLGDKRGKDETFGGLLIRKAAEGVKVLVLLWNETTALDATGRLPQGSRALEAPGEKALRRFFKGSKVVLRRVARPAGRKEKDLRGVFGHNQKFIVCDAPRLTQADLEDTERMGALVERRPQEHDFRLEETRTARGSEKRSAIPRLSPPSPELSDRVHTPGEVTQREPERPASSRPKNAEPRPNGTEQPLPFPAVEKPIEKEKENWLPEKEKQDKPSSSTPSPKHPFAVGAEPPAPPAASSGSSLANGAGGEGESAEKEKEKEREGEMAAAATEEVAEAGRGEEGEAVDRENTAGGDAAEGEKAGGETVEREENTGGVSLSSKELEAEKAAMAAASEEQDASEGGERERGAGGETEPEPFARPAIIVTDGDAHTDVAGSEGLFHDARSVDLEASQAASQTFTKEEEHQAVHPNENEGGAQEESGDAAALAAAVNDEVGAYGNLQPPPAAGLDLGPDVIATPGSRMAIPQPGQASGAASQQEDYEIEQQQHVDSSPHKGHLEEYGQRAGWTGAQDGDSWAPIPEERQSHASFQAAAAAAVAASHMSAAAAKREGDSPSLHAQKRPVVSSSDERRRVVGFVGSVDFRKGCYDHPGHPLFGTGLTVHRGDAINRVFPDVDAAVGPREPQHHAHAKIEGPAARDLLMAFEERWRKSGTHMGISLVNSQDTKKRFISPKEEAEPFMAMKNRFDVRILRSIDNHSAAFSRRNLFEKEGKKVDDSIYRAYIHVIRRAQHCLYVEAEAFFGGAQYWEKRPEDVPSVAASVPDRHKSEPGCLQLVPFEIAKKIADFIKHDRMFTAYVLLPMHPEGDPHSDVVQQQLRYQAETMKMMYRMISSAIEQKVEENVKRRLGIHKVSTFGFEVEGVGAVQSSQSLQTLLNQLGDPQISKMAEEIRKEERTRIGEPADYLLFLCLGQRSKDVHALETAPVTDNQRRLLRVRRHPIQVMSNVMIADDQYAIVGSAGLTTRSLAGTRDTEIAVGCHQPAYEATESRVPRGEVHAFRLSLWQEHFGKIMEAFRDPQTRNCMRTVQESVWANWAQYMSDTPSDMEANVLPYPLVAGPDGELYPITNNGCFPDTSAPVWGGASSLASILTA